MSKVLCLGGAGFIGSYITRELLQHAHQVTVVDNFSKYGPVEHDYFAHPACELVVKDVRGMMPDEFQGFDYVLCLAALIGGIRYFHSIPYRIARENTEILTRAIDCTLDAAPEALFVYFSSSMVYERVLRPVTEADALTQQVPLTNYGMQKLFGEYLVRGAHEEYGLRYLTVRPFNAVGSGELPATGRDGLVEFGMAHVIPDFIYKALIRQSPFEIFGDGEQIRTFTHARDIAYAVRRLLEIQVSEDDFNVCGPVSISMADLAMRIWQHVNPQVMFPGFSHTPVPPSDVRMRIGTSEKLMRVLRWRPGLGIDAIIDDSLQYVRGHMTWDAAVR